MVANAGGLTRQDLIVLEALRANEDAKDEEAVRLLQSMSNPKAAEFEATVLTGHDGCPSWLLPLAPWIGANVVRHPTDVVFGIHIGLYLTTVLPSAILLFRHFTYFHAVLHWALQLYCVGSFTLLMHNHIHHNGVLQSWLGTVDQLFPYVLNPLFGHAQNSYFYHHVKHHHAEGNGPIDLSSTLRYQRDSVLDFLHYVGRFVCFVWLELPLYFWAKGRKVMAAKCLAWELASYAFVGGMAYWRFRPALFALIIPLVQMRIGLMAGNWGQHALIDEVEPTSDLRSSITLVDVASNRHCFNDGYHTSHHLNPLRHWREHPAAFLSAKAKYSSERALVFTGIDYLEITFRVLRKDYLYLAGKLVPLGDQKHMSQEELARMLQRKTMRFSEAQIQQLWGQGK